MNIDTVRRNLIRRGYTVTCCETAAECADYLDRAIDGVTLGIGSSATVQQLGVLPRLKRHNTVYWHQDPEQLAELGHSAIRNLAKDADCYMCSVNGMSQDGVIINIDGAGQRLSAMTFGHKKIYLIVGVNKIAPDFEQALWRARNIAGPLDAQRLNCNTPCAAKADKCYDCQVPDRICRGFLVLDRAMTSAETEVVLVNESLGF